MVLVPMVKEGDSFLIGQYLPMTFGVVYEKGVGLWQTNNDNRIIVGLISSTLCMMYILTFPLTATLKVQRSVVGYGSASILYRISVCWGGGGEERELHHM